MRALGLKSLRLAAAALACLLCSACTGLFLHPDRVFHLPNLMLGTKAEDVEIVTPDGLSLHALWMPVPPELRNASLLYLHGNAENLSGHAHMVSWLPRHGYQVLALDYRGFGRSQGEADLAGAHVDAEAALSWLLAKGHDETGPVMVYGQSLGGSIAIRALAQSNQRNQVAALVSDSAFASYRRIAREKLSLLWLTWPFQWPLSFLISDQLAAEDVIAYLAPMPILLMHGEADAVVPVSHVHRLFDAAGEPKQLILVDNGHHIDGTQRRAAREGFLQFLQGVVDVKTPLRIE